MKDIKGWRTERWDQEYGYGKIPHRDDGVSIKMIVEKRDKVVAYGYFGDSGMWYKTGVDDDFKFFDLSNWNNEAAVY